MPVNQSNPLWNFWPRNRVRLSWLSALMLLVWVVFAKPLPLAIASPSGLLASWLIVSGALLRAWSAGIVHKDQRLAVGGPYALCRHPLYVGSFLAVAGVMLMLGGWGLMLCAVFVFAILYLPTARNEEQVLAAEFAHQWANYTQTTAMLFPRSLAGLPRRVSSGIWRVAQWRYNREYQTPLMTLVAVLIMQIIRVWRL